MAYDQNTERAGTVFDIGYQSYEGAREGRSRARRTMFWDGVKNGMGIGRGGWAKFLPWLVVAPTIITGLIFAGIAIFFEQLGFDVDDAGEAVPLDLPGHDELIGVITFLLLVFAAFVGPELICPDRRNRVIHLYFVRPITLLDYLGARLVALMALLFVAGMVPHVALWIGTLIGVTDPMDHIRDNWQDIWRFVANSAVFAVFAASFAFALSSVTDRRMIAALIIMGVLILSSIVPGIVGLFSPPDTVNDLVQLTGLIDFNSAIVPSLIFGSYGDDYDLQVAAPIAWWLLLTGLSLLGFWRFYSRQR